MNWIGLIIGAALGGLIALVTQCPGNTCPLTSRWYIPVIIGAVLGLIWQPTTRPPAEPPAEDITENEFENNNENSGE